MTIKGNVHCSRAMEARPWFWDRSDGNHTPIIFALESTPAIARQLETIMEGYPDRGLGVEDVLRIQDEFVKHLTHSIVPGPIADKINKDMEAGSQLLAVTGRIFEKDGMRWISVLRHGPARLTYPAKMLAPDRPLATPAGEPLRLKIGDTLTLTCNLLPACRFLQGSRFISGVIRTSIPTRSCSPGRSTCRRFP